MVGKVVFGKTPENLLAVAGMDNSSWDVASDLSRQANEEWWSDRWASMRYTTDVLKRQPIAAGQHANVSSFGRFDPNQGSRDLDVHLGQDPRILTREQLEAAGYTTGSLGDGQSLGR